MSFRGTSFRRRGGSRTSGTSSGPRHRSEWGSISAGRDHGVSVPATFGVERTSRSFGGGHPAERGGRVSFSLLVIAAPALACDGEDDLVNDVDIEVDPSDEGSEPPMATVSEVHAHEAHAILQYGLQFLPDRPAQ